MAAPPDPNAKKVCFFYLQRELLVDATMGTRHYIYIYTHTSDICWSCMHGFKKCLCTPVLVVPPRCRC